MSHVTSAAGVRLVCPRCHGDLDRDEAASRCTACGAHYPVVAGIADLRVQADPWLAIEDDREKALRLDEATSGLDFATSVRRYWEMTPGTPRDLAERFIRHVLGAEQRSAAWLDAWASDGTGPWLEIGCGTGDLVAAAATRGITVVGADIALRWLVMARRRLGLRGGEHTFVCCDAAHLPFATRAFGRVVALGLLEHLAVLVPALTESRRVLARGGELNARTTNRYTLLPEPHVGMWGVGFLPRRHADAYVRLRSGRRYLLHHPRSPRELMRDMRTAGFHRVTIEAAALLAPERDRLPVSLRLVAPVYSALRRAPIARAALRWVAPLLDVTGRAT